MCVPYGIHSSVQVWSRVAVHKGDREEDTCHRNIWASQVVMRWEVTASEIPGDPPELGSSYGCGGICGQEEVLGVS